MATGSDHQVLLDGHDVDAERLDDWRILFRTLHARFTTADLAAGGRLVQAVIGVATAAGHGLEVDLAPARIDVRLASPDVGGVTQRDVRLAREISAVAAQQGAVARPEQLSVLELALDSPRFDEVKPFWAALLGYEPGRHDDREITDPDGTMPTIWGQATDPHDPPRQRWHLDLRVPPEAAADRVRAALDAGGTLVTDVHAPAFWVLADAQGNQACLTTWQGRD